MKGSLLLRRMALLLLMVSTLPVSAGVLLTQEEALALAFADATAERRTAFLRPADLDRATTLAGTPVEDGLVSYYEGIRSGAVIGTAYFESHMVRTLPESLMVVVAPDGTILRVEVLSFDEPKDYLPKEHWYRQLDGRPLDDQLSLKRAVRPISGATLTTKATTESVRRVLALHQVIGERRAVRRKKK